MRRMVRRTLATATSSVAVPDMATCAAVTAKRCPAVGLASVTVGMAPSVTTLNVDAGATVVLPAASTTVTTTVKVPAPVGVHPYDHVLDVAPGSASTTGRALVPSCHAVPFQKRPSPRLSVIVAEPSAVSSPAVPLMVSGARPTT